MKLEKNNYRKSESMTDSFLEASFEESTVSESEVKIALNSN